jgi:predicted nucleotidyltransferase
MDKETIKSKILSEIEKNPVRAKVKKVSLFGSHLSNTNKSYSDVDVLIEFKPDAEVGFFGLSRLQDEFKQVLNIEVDLVTPEALSKYFRDKVLSKAELIYEGK